MTDDACKAILLKPANIWTDAERHTLLSKMKEHPAGESRGREEMSAFRDKIEAESQ